MNVRQIFTVGRGTREKLYTSVVRVQGGSYGAPQSQGFVTLVYADGSTYRLERDCRIEIDSDGAVS